MTSPRPVWLVQPCPACRHTAFYLEREQRSGLVRVLCQGCGAEIMVVERIEGKAG